MGTTTAPPLSTALSELPARTRISRQTIHTLTFIHRFRHVTTRHVQLSLGHASPTTTNTHLRRLRAAGFIDRHRADDDRLARRACSYFLTPEGLRLLRTVATDGRYRRPRSLDSDRVAGLQRRTRYHQLADTFVHFKRHYDGQFSFFTDTDLRQVASLPDETPDGYVRLSLPDMPVQHYFIEIYGLNRSTQDQARRLRSYVRYAEDFAGTSPSTDPPALFLIAGSSRTQERAHSQLKSLLRHSFAEHFRVYTTVASKLDTEATTIWRAL